jgi:pimeloyl-ACP methyl ester carboxylesterase
MKLPTLMLLVGLVLSPAARAQAQSANPAAAACDPALLDIAGNKIWADRQGSGSITVVFESGFGNDSSVWASITPRLRAAGVQTFVYDRAGMGKSSINTATPYSVDNDVHILRTTLTACGVNGPLVMVGHSYGGGMALLAASQDPHIRGVVLLDAVVPKVWANGELEKNLAAMRAQYDDIRKQAPDLAKVAIPYAEALPQTVQRLDGVAVAADLPIIDIVAEKGMNNPAAAQTWRDAHLAFTAGNPNRDYILATGSSHKVMTDQPDLVVNSILRMLNRISKP